jgi:hypothetical protein
MKKLVQQGRSERRPEAYSVRYVEGLSDARTQLESFCIILSSARLDRPPKRAFLILLHGLIVLHERRGELMRPVVFRYEVERS